MALLSVIAGYKSVSNQIIALEYNGPQSNFGYQVEYQSSSGHHLNYRILVTTTGATDAVNRICGTAVSKHQIALIVQFRADFGRNGTTFTGGAECQCRCHQIFF
jgi:hypothetical protein